VGKTITKPCSTSKWKDDIVYIWFDFLIIFGPNKTKLHPKAAWRKTNILLLFCAVSLKKHHNFHAKQFQN
jgi:hypothetical protein